ncbi:MAG: aminodeoxychorismate/anthranilate synthase component II [Cytophagales bacterium]|nr:MAG: aminodeoxychorismate/anthranilate synthase component II [Cytophagales bacterium]
MKIIVIDNYDSFVYNLVHLLKELGAQPTVVRNDKIALEDIAKYDKILLSPGPGIPSEAGLLLEIVKHYSAQKSILGVCLGHQAIGEVFGSPLAIMPDVQHGLATEINVLEAENTLFKNLPQRFKVGRYHSWVIEKTTIQPDLQITAEDEQGFIMAIQHRKYALSGVQFHPESVLTEHGKQLMTNWLQA